MDITYAVFFDRRKISFLSEPLRPAACRGTLIKESANWEDFEEFIRSDKTSLAYVSKDPARLFRQFATMFQYVEAAGGLVSDPAGYWLFIFRRDRWDLPKGMMEQNEPVRDAAIREVTEECGIERLEILHPLPQTYHVYETQNGVWALKKTHWYYMQTKTCCQAEPQVSEGITRAEWKHPDHLADVMQNTYGNIKELLRFCQQFKKQA